MFDLTKAKPTLDYSQVAFDQIMEVIRSNKKEKLFSGMNSFRDQLTKVDYFNGIPSTELIKVIDNFTYLDFFPDDAEKTDYSNILEQELLKILADNEFHSKASIIEICNEKFSDDISSEFNEIVKKLSTSDIIIKFDKNKNAVEKSGKGSGKYSFLKLSAHYEVLGTSKTV